MKLTTLERRYRIGEVSAFTGYRPATIRNKIRKGELSAQKIGRVVTVSEGEIRRFLAHATLPHTPAA